MTYAERVDQWSKQVIAGRKPSMAVCTDMIEELLKYSAQLTVVEVDNLKSLSNRLVT